MGNRTSVNPVQEDTVNDSGGGDANDVRRLRQVWSDRQSMTAEELYSTILTHPDIPEESKGEVYAWFCKGAPKLGFSELLSAVQTLEHASPHEREAFFTQSIPTPTTEEVAVEASPSNGHHTEDVSLHSVLAGVTHFDEMEIIALEDAFGRFADPTEMRIRQDPWKAQLAGIVSPDMAEGLFRTFDEDHDGRIDFKEFICGLSSLCRGPDGERLKFMGRIWCSPANHLTHEDLRRFAADLKVENIGESPSLPSPIPLVDFTCWLTEEHPVATTELLQLSQQIGLLALGLPPSSPNEQLEVICDLKRRLQLEDLETWFVVPWGWWSQLVVALNPHTHNGEIPSIDNTSILTERCMDEKSPLFGCPILKPSLAYRKDYELIPKFLFDCLVNWNRVRPLPVSHPSLKSTHHHLYWSPIERTVLDKANFPLDGPTTEALGKDFPASHYPELYPPVVRLLRHPPHDSRPMQQNGYVTWSYVVISRRTTMGEVRQSACKRISQARGATDPSELRLWLLTEHGENGRRQGLKTLLNDDSLSLQEVGLRPVGAQMLLEMRNRDMSWPEEIRQFVDAERRERSAMFNKGQRRASTNSNSDGMCSGVVNIGNTCYISAAVQTLSNISDLTQYLLLEGDEKHEKNRSVGPVVGEYRSVIRELFDHNTSALPNRLKVYLWVLFCPCWALNHWTMNSIKEAISKKTSLFGDRLQHDCQEFLQILLDSLHAELRNGATNNAYGLDDTAALGDDASLKAWQQQCKKDGLSIVSQLFNGQQRSQLKCLSCPHISTTFETFSCIQLPIPIDDITLVYVHVLNEALEGARYAFRLPANNTYADLKKEVSLKTAIPAPRLRWLIRDEVSGSFKDFDGTGDDALLSTFSLPNIGVYAYEVDSSRSHALTVHRRMVYKPVHAIAGIDDFETALFGLPLFMPIEEDVMQEPRRLHEGLDRRFTELLTSRSKGPSAGDSKLLNRAMDASEDSRAGFPFQLSLTLWPDARWCGRCPWSRFCHGCPLGAVEGEELSFSKGTETLLTIDWKPAALYLRYSQCTTVDFTDDESVAVCERLHSQPMSLAQCFAEYISPELIDDSKCDGCSRITSREKSLTLWRMPKILVVHLKRFIYDSRLGKHVKSTKPVDFPLEDFEPTPYMGRVKNGTLNAGVTYRCIAIVNHHGNINQGHYTSYVRKGEDRWFFFNDSYSKAVEESAIDKQSAYLLFYEKVTPHRPLAVDSN